MAADDRRRRAARLFERRVILSPMVRANELPFRLLCLDGGADVVYTPEIIGEKLAGAQRERRGWNIHCHCLPHLALLLLLLT